MTSDHPRNTGPMLASQRCGAKTRKGGSCKAPTVTGKKRCRMHGGKAGRKPTHGRYAKAAIAERRKWRALLMAMRGLIDNVR